MEGARLHPVLVQLDAALEDMVTAASESLPPYLARSLLQAITMALQRILLDGGPYRSAPLLPCAALCCAGLSCFELRLCCAMMCCAASMLCCAVLCWFIGLLCCAVLVQCCAVLCCPASLVGLGHWSDVLQQGCYHEYQAALPQTFPVSWPAVTLQWLSIQHSCYVVSAMSGVLCCAACTPVLL